MLPVPVYYNLLNSGFCKPLRRIYVKDRWICDERGAESDDWVNIG